MSDEVSTAGHGPTKGYSKMNNHLKAYFRKQGGTVSHPSLPCAKPSRRDGQRQPKKRKSVK